MLVGFDELNKSELTKLSREIRSQVSASMNAMFDSITGELHLMTDDEAEFVRELYDDYTTAALTALEVGAVVSTADNALISLESGGRVNTGVWADFIKENINTANKMVDGVVLKGFRDGQTLQQITSELRGSYNRGTKKYVGGVINGRMTQYAETLARTGVSHYSNQARDKFAAKNKSAINKQVFFATLDNRTTTTCLGFHLDEFELDDNSKPTLPIHYNERSVYLFKGDGIDPLAGDRPLIGGKNTKSAREEFEARQSRTDRKVKYKGRKDSDVFDVEQVSAKVTSQQWLERQPRFFVESTLGKTRAALFLDGKLPIEKFTDLQGRSLTLAELRDTAAGERAFRRAGID